MGAIKAIFPFAFNSAARNERRWKINVYFSAHRQKQSLRLLLLRCLWWFIIYQPHQRDESRVERKKMWHFDLSSVVEIPLYACKTSRLARWFLPFTFASRRQGHLPPKLISHSSHYFPRKKRKKQHEKSAPCHHQFTSCAGARSAL